MSTTAQPAVTYPPGWYFDPAGQVQRYWDGASWTGHTAPLAQAIATGPQKPQTRTGDWVGAVLLPLVMPAIGLVAGLIWAVMGGAKRQPGIVCLGASAAMIVLYLLLMQSA